MNRARIPTALAEDHGAVQSCDGKLLRWSALTDTEQRERQQQQNAHKSLGLLVSPTEAFLKLCQRL
jgi:hypothetical protein